MPILDVSLPANLSRVFDTLTKIAAFDIYEIGELVEQSLKLESLEPINEKFESIGLESKYFINNLGTFFLVLVFYAACVTSFILLWLLSFFNKRYIGKLKARLGEILFWNKLISLVKESFLVVILCALIALTYHYKMDTTGD